MRAFGVTRRSGDTSSRPCGCDPGTSHVCAWHSRGIAVEPEVIQGVERTSNGVGMAVAGPLEGGDFLLIFDQATAFSVRLSRFAAEQLVDALEERLGGDFGE